MHIRINFSPAIPNTDNLNVRVHPDASWIFHLSNNPKLAAPERRGLAQGPTDNSKVSIHSPWILISRYPLTLLTRSGGGRSLLPSAAIVSCARTSSSSISFSITCRSFGENSVTSSRQAEKSCRAWAKSWENRENVTPVFHMSAFWVSLLGVIAIKLIWSLCLFCFWELKH